MVASGAGLGLPAHFVDLEQIGSGGSGSVYAATDERFRRRVAIKIINARADADDELRRYLREVQVMGQLSSHPHIVTVFDAALSTLNRPYLVMELMEGGSAQGHLRETGPFGWQRAATIGIQVAGALWTAHRSGVLHRDIKPSNILFNRRGDAGLTDFGIARFVDMATTVTGELAFTPLYASPEMIDGSDVSHAADVYSLGATLYEFIAGRPVVQPDPSGSVFSLMAKIKQGVSPPRPENVSDGLWLAILRALQPRQSDRFSSAAEFGEALRAALQLVDEIAPSMVLDVGAEAPVVGIAEQPVDGPALRFADGRIFTLGEGPTTFGRDASLQARADGVHVADSEFSRHHFVLDSSAEATTVRDLGSSNGTFLGRSGDWLPVGMTEPTALVAGDSLRVGSLIIEVRLPEPPEPSAKLDVVTDESATAVPASPLVVSAAEALPVTPRIRVDFPSGTRWEPEPGVVPEPAAAPSAAGDPAPARVTLPPPPSAPPPTPPYAHQPQLPSLAGGAELIDLTQTFVGRIDRSDAQPDYVGPFKVLDTIAHGKTGPLYKVWDQWRDAVVALKLIEVHDESTRARLSRGTTVWLGLSHPALLTIHHVHPPHQGTPGYILMDFIDGVDLDGLPTLDSRQLATIGIQLAEALQHLHDNGVIHRELVASNVRVDPATLRTTLLDSGIARPLQRSPALDITLMQPLADHEHMAPEQRQFGQIDTRSDIYGLGALLFQAGTGKSITGTDELQIDTALRAAQLHEIVQSAIKRMLAEEPAARTQSGEDVARSLRPLSPKPIEVVPASEVIVSLHGINTHARWQRALSDVATQGGLSPRLDRWNFGHFAVWRFLVPWARLAKINWFRSTYSAEFPEIDAFSAELPTIVAHSFGTYVLGNSMLRFENIRFGKVILCGSILPRDFDWELLIERGQVAHVRNEYGARDIWTRHVELAVPGTGRSGLAGFVTPSHLIEQESFDYAHSDYFEAGHMRAEWLPFIQRPVPSRVGEPAELLGGRVRSYPPIGAWVLLLTVMALLIAAGVLLLR